MNIASGIAPIRRYLEQGLRVGLGTDVAGGNSESMFQAVVDAIQVSKLYWRYIDRKAKPLTFPEALYLATKGGGAFFGKAGSLRRDMSLTRWCWTTTGSQACGRCRRRSGWSGRFTTSWTDRELS